MKSKHCTKVLILFSFFFVEGSSSILFIISYRLVQKFYDKNTKSVEDKPTGWNKITDFKNQVFIMKIKSFYSIKPVLRGHSKRRPKIGFQDPLSLNAGQKYCRILPLEHSAIISTFIKLPFVIKTFVLSIFEWPLKMGFTEFTF